MKTTEMRMLRMIGGKTLTAKINENISKSKGCDGWGMSRETKKEVQYRHYT